jgi:predicted DNA-binding protein (MmcQ/YjbR family)
MLFDAFHEAVLALPESAFEVKFRNKRTYVVGGRTFARAGLVGQDAPCYGFKAGPAFELLIELKLARHMAYLGRARWVELLTNDALPDADLLTYVNRSYELVRQASRRR